MNATEPVVSVAVIGVGHLGSRHAERLAGSGRFHVVSLFDRVPGRAVELAAKLGTTAARSLDEALASATAVVIASSTEAHREIAEAALRAGRHVLVEKPSTGRPADARALVDLAAERGLVLQVGYVERFNPALRGLLGRIPPPLFVESHRLAPLVPRSLDIDVVQDLMIHDIDLTLAFVGETPESVEAAGVSVVTDRVDIANARLRFPGGATANLTASRVSLDRTRKFRIFLRGAYVSADCAARTSQIYRLRADRGEQLAAMLGRGEPADMLRFLEHETLGPAGEDPLTAEHDAFARAIRGESGDGVSGADALAALEVMVRVEEAIRRSGGALG